MNEMTGLTSDRANTKPGKDRKLTEQFGSVEFAASNPSYFRSMCVCSSTKHIDPSD